MRIVPTLFAIIATLMTGYSTSDSTSDATSVQWQAPVDELVVIRRFDPPTHQWSSGHRGVDLAAGPGAVVKAPTAGVVSFAGWVVDRPVITVAAGALRSSMEPVQALVPVGTAVKPGQPIGVVADYPVHCAEQSCLHWGVRHGDSYIDPLSFLAGTGPIVLLAEGQATSAARMVDRNLPTAAVCI